MSHVVVFKTYDQSQLSLLPPSYDELVPKNHPVRVVDAIIENLDLSSLEKSYKGGGTSSYHPKMLLKVVVYAYLRNLYSSRKIEQALYENVHFMWLSGQSKPDHGTINNFRSQRLKGELKQIFNQVVLFLAEQGVLSLKDIYVDGTKIEANANRYTFVWGKAIKTSKTRIQRQLKELWAYTEKVCKEELKQSNTPDFEKISPEAVSQTIDQINASLKGKEVDKKVRQKLNYAKRNWPDKLKKYEEQEKQMAGRNSCSKTDPDATFMRMKDDHMQNGQLKPGYNVQGSSNNQYLTGYTVEQTTTDTTTLINQLEEHRKAFGGHPESLTADAGYGSEENYQYLEKNKVEGFVKYNYFHKEQLDRKRGKDNPFSPENFHYNQERDAYYCPMGQQMSCIGTIERTTSTGYTQTYKRYQARNCLGCPLRGQCHKASGNRIIERNHNLIRLKEKARNKLLSDQGIIHRKRRCWEIEAIFGNIKQNMNFKRFLLRGLDNVNTEIGLIAMAHNLKKFAMAT